MVRRIPLVLPLVMAAAWSLPAAAQQCCLSELFAGCGGCLRRPPAYAVAPVMAPMMAPMPAPPQPVMVPVAKTSYVPETTYRTQMQTVPVTTYKPSCEIDPCTGCPRECMQPVTEYVQQAVNVPVTQYRAVTTTQYVQVPQGYAAPPYAPGQMPPAPMMAPPLVPIPEIQRSSPPGQGSVAPAAPGVPAAPGPTGTAPATTPANPTTPNPAATPRTTSPAPSAPGMPTVPGSGPSSATGAFPRLLEPTGHTTSWQPAAAAGRPALFMPAYPTAALPARLQQ